jgi:hypothetical protein
MCRALFEIETLPFDAETGMRLNFRISNRAFGASQFAAAETVDLAGKGRLRGCSSNALD